MKIGDSNLDRIWKEVYIPAIKECGLEPKRVDKHNEGRLLTSEIAEFIKRARIIIADLTGERPNCYLEVGYAMGKDKFTNLILCAKKDEYIHFDLSSYDFVRWGENDLNLFKNELVKKINYRLKILNEVGTKLTQDSKDIENWITEERKIATERFTKLQIGDGFIEVIFLPVGIEIDRIVKKKADELRTIARNSECHNTGWPIGVVLDNREELRPKRVEKGVRAIIDDSSSLLGQHFDYWMLREDGCFYFFRNLESETNNDKRILYIDIRVYRLAEVFLYCSRLFKEFDFSNTNRIKIFIKHSGLKDRLLSVADRGRMWSGDRYQCVTGSVSYEFEDTLDNVELNIKLNVYEVARDLFDYFDFGISQKVTDEIVDKFLKSRM